MNTLKTTAVALVGLALAGVHTHVEADDIKGFNVVYEAMNQENGSVILTDKPCKRDERIKDPNEDPNDLPKYAHWILTYTPQGGRVTEGCARHGDERVNFIEWNSGRFSDSYFYAPASLNQWTKVNVDWTKYIETGRLTLKPITRGDLVVGGRPAWRDEDILYHIATQAGGVRILSNVSCRWIESFARKTHAGQEIWEFSTSQPNRDTLTYKGCASVMGDGRVFASWTGGGGHTILPPLSAWTKGYPGGVHVSDEEDVPADGGPTKWQIANSAEETDRLSQAPEAEAAQVTAQNTETVAEMAARLNAEPKRNQWHKSWRKRERKRKQRDRK